MFGETQETQSSAAFLADDAPKAFTAGTHRRCSPRETLEALRPKFQKLGITRVADVTGLDRIGIPVAQAVRPMSRSLSVKQGKGLSVDTAFASAAMEAAEAWHAEKVSLPIWRGTAESLSTTAPIADLSGLCGCGEAAQLARTPLSWVAGVDLLKETPTYVPFDCVHLDFTRPAETGMLERSSNGLASGNTLPEAVHHALLEVIERDCLAGFWTSGAAGQARSRMDNEALAARYPTVADLLGKLAEAVVQVDLFDLTNDLGVPTVLARIYETGAPAFARGPTGAMAPAIGHGSHLDPEIAITRAITEAAQSRLTRIAGSRDDLLSQDYTPVPDNNMTQVINQLFDQADHPPAAFAHQDQSGPSTRADLEVLLNKLQAAGLEQVIALDIGQPDIGIGVARVIVPGLGVIEGHHGYRVGRRNQ